MNKNSWGGMLIILGLIFIFASYSELDGPMSGRSLTDEERDYWAPKCIDWLSDAHPYWMSDGSNMCFEYEKGWNYTTVAIGVLMIIGGIACFFDFSQNEMTSMSASDKYVHPAIEGIENRKANASQDLDLDEELKKLEGELNQTGDAPINKTNNEKTVKPKDEIKPTKKKDDNLINELKKLNNLKEQGIIDDDEFKAAKQKIIEKL